MLTSQNLGGAPATDKETMAAELAKLSRTELQDMLGVDKTDDRTNEELQKAILAQAFATPRVPAADPAPDAEESAPAGEGGGKKLVDLVDPNSPGAVPDRQHRTEINRTKALLDAMPKRTLYLPQRAPNDKRGQLPPVSCQINDYTYWVPRGVACEVPEEVHRIIIDAGHMVAE